jgi:pimeloyl-ACP methyl ester carboxylesterase
MLKSLKSSILLLCGTALMAQTGPSAPLAPPPLGKLYDVGGHKMHLYCVGSGSPTVVLEAGAGAFALDWYFVQPGVARITRVCSYDRAGHGWSELGPLPRTAVQAAHDLNALLHAAGEKGPFVVVGHSLGGVISRLFERAYPDQVAGMVFLDIGTETSLQFIDGRWTRWFSEAKPRAIPAPRTTIADSERVLSRVEENAARDFWKNVQPPVIDGPYEKLPADIQKLRLWAMSQPSAVTTDYDPYLAEELTVLLADRIEHEHLLGDRPLIVIGRTPDTIPRNVAPNSGPARRVTERPVQLRELGELSTNSLVLTASNSRHEIHLDQPELVIDAVDDVVRAVRTHGALRPLTTGVTSLATR